MTVYLFNYSMSSVHRLLGLRRLLFPVMVPICVHRLLARNDNYYSDSNNDNM